MLTNESLFDITTIPDHLAIIGAGIIAIELAFAFRKLGTKVSLIALDPRALPTYSPESRSNTARVDKLGIETHYNATGDSFDESTHTLTIRSAQNTYPLNDVDKVLIAIGRIRNIDNLGLDLSGVLWGKTGIIVDGFGRDERKRRIRSR
jgi:pyruvate/2-oxoglutarate dehydrogenase complex dihydrolipoamide dehydrogenase (E3) component